jgi:ubiquinone/menaquinone biosynthesis C-methylase UbiE
MSNPLSRVAHSWTELGDTDPMWAALTDGGRGGRWDPAEFLRTGRAEIADLMALLDRRGVTPKLDTALDFGCGPGRLTAGLAAAGFGKAIGVDISPTMLAKARELVDDDRCEFVHNDSPELSVVADDSVDLVYTCRVLQHMPRELAYGYIKQFIRITRPGGVVAFQLPYVRRGVVGHGIEAIPKPLLNRLRSGMEMYGSEPSVVSRVVSDAGGVTLSIENDNSAGPRWYSHLYLVRPAK